MITRKDLQEAWGYWGTSGLLTNIADAIRAERDRINQEYTNKETAKLMENELNNDITKIEYLAYELKS